MPLVRRGDGARPAQCDAAVDGDDARYCSGARAAEGALADCGSGSALGDDAARETWTGSLDALPERETAPVVERVGLGDALGAALGAADPSREIESRARSAAPSSSACRKRAVARSAAAASASAVAAAESERDATAAVPLREKDGLVAAERNRCGGGGAVGDRSGDRAGGERPPPPRAACVERGGVCGAPAPPRKTP